MAAYLQQRGLSTSRLLLSYSSQERSLYSDALVELKLGEIDVISDIPQEHLRHKVKIFSPSRTATQQADPYATVGDAGLCFDNEKAAKLFIERHGWDYMVKKHLTPLLKPKAYGFTRNIKVSAILSVLVLRMDTKDAQDIFLDLKDYAAESNESWQPCQLSPLIIKSSAPPADQARMIVSSATFFVKTDHALGIGAHAQRLRLWGPI